MGDTHNFTQMHREKEKENERKREFFQFQIKLNAKANIINMIKSKYKNV